MLYCCEDRGRMNLIKPNPNKYNITLGTEPALGASGNTSGRTIYLSFVYANNLIYLKDSELTVLRHKMYFYSRLFVEKGICSNSSNQVHNEVVNRPVS